MIEHWAFAVRCGSVLIDWNCRNFLLQISDSVAPRQRNRNASRNRNRHFSWTILASGSRKNWGIFSHSHFLWRPLSKLTYLLMSLCPDPFLFLCEFVVSRVMESFGLLQSYLEYRAIQFQPHKLTPHSALSHKYVWHTRNNALPLNNSHHSRTQPWLMITFAAKIKTTICHNIDLVSRIVQLRVVLGK